MGNFSFKVLKIPQSVNRGVTKSKVHSEMLQFYVLNVFLELKGDNIALIIWLELTKYNCSNFCSTDIFTEEVGNLKSDTHKQKFGKVLGVSNSIFSAGC